ncbi:putative ADIPOR-like receptor [Clavispora lusitaniae]|uniref:ADIPOR-like receptor n=1 Tax=Clavispora lusitaniae TaxID=36911 RepID=A0ACD0WDY0_CLALS|nr:putative ADIPOR-like receptor [Clavispora lusitaniae]QFZ31256.1 putative ADIPOR-like receptor [Clavispora lusitaniae]QFZ36924.1 putative ADIPOR-like receptor [Clavispora lusitaniae]QFZ42608.1 putative ADIPOR-like receptor [Clavispora lusitaniae]QFZ48284.1 putative ADIPOR-like receptor [Clavispora lusitaniae]
MSLRQRNTTSNTYERKEPNAMSKARRVYYYHELDPWQQDNHYIRSGYVKETASYKECIKSLTYLHNESVNVYSHLLPSIFSSIAVIVFINWRIEKYENDLGIWERLNFLQFGGAATFCLTSSALFHLFKSHSHKASKFGNQCDYFGIIVMITCSLNSIILFAFYDVPKVRNGFLLLFFLLGTACTKVTFDDKFSTPDYRPFRSFMFILFGLSGTLPIVAGVKMFGWKDAIGRSAADWCCAEGVFYILGACLYALRVPERFFHIEHPEGEEETLLDKMKPGKFDLFGHSHQIFHVMVVVAAYCHWKALVACYHYLHTRTLS